MGMWHHTQACRICDSQTGALVLNVRDAASLTSNPAQPLKLRDISACTLHGGVSLIGDFTAPVYRLEPGSTKPESPGGKSPFISTCFACNL